MEVAASAVSAMRPNFENNSLIPRREQPVNATAILQPIRVPAPPAESVSTRSDAAGLAWASLMNAIRALTGTLFSV